MKDAREWLTQRRIDKIVQRNLQFLAPEKRSRGSKRGAAKEQAGRRGRFASRLAIHFQRV
jgi:hypothetical protein